MSGAADAGRASRASTIKDLCGRTTTPCRGQSALFFSKAAEDIERARAICASCPRRLPCAAGAIARQEPDGVWGGLTAEELRRI